MTLDWMEPNWDTKRVQCVHCSGTGKNPKKRKVMCPECKGDGDMTVCVKCLKEKCICIPCQRCKEYPCVCSHVYY